MPSRLTLEPIGVVHSPLKSKAEAARQPAAATEATARIELYPGRNFEHALEDLEFSRRQTLHPLRELAVGPPLHPEPR